jgi:hypothetical protein
LITALGCPISYALEGAEVITLLKHGKDPTFLHNLRPIHLLSTTGKPFEKVILKIVQKNIEVRSLLNASQFGFHAICIDDTCLYVTELKEFFVVRNLQRGLSSMQTW